MRKLFFLFLVLVATTSLWAEDFSVDGIYYNYLDGNNVEVTYRGSSYINHDEYSGEVIIPETVTYNGVTYSVTSIGGSAFSHCSSLTSITIPNSVTSIGSSAFSYCSSLTSITIPESVTSIGYYAFSGCSALTSITIPNSVTSIGNYAFENCSSLTSITIPEGVTTIGHSFGCSSLTTVVWNAIICDYSTDESSIFGNSPITSITFGENVKIIPNCICFGLDLLTSVTIPESVTSIGGRAFSGCSSLTSVSIGNSVTSIGYDAFSGCSALTSITIPESVTSIGGYAFSGCSGLTSIIVEGGNTIYDSREHCNAIVETATNTLIVGCQSTIIPNSVTSIGYGAFEHCSSLTSITIPNSVTSIESDAFSGTSIAYITIPESVTSIGYSFHGCSSLTTVEWNAHNAQGMANDGPFRGCPIASFTFGEKVKHIPYRLCSGLTLLTSVTIPNSVTSIGNDAFENCYFTKDNFINNSSLDAEANNYWGAKVVDLEIDGLLIRNATVIYCRPYVTAAVIPNSVTSIGDYAFRNCKSLTSVTIPNSVTSIGNSAFYNCSALTSVSIGNSVTSIGGGAFEGCSSLTSITIPNSVMSIGDRTFYNCSALTSVSIGNSVTSIGDYAFAYCYALTSVSIGNSVTSIGDFAFAYCYALTSVSIGDSVTSIGTATFEDCSALTSVSIGNSVTSIGGRAFCDCSKLTSITIPNSVTSIGGRAFEGCSALTSITCEARIPPTIGIGAIDPFAYVNKSIPVYVPCGCVSAYKAASTWKYFTNIQEPQAEYSIQVSTSNIQMGTAKVDYNTYCDGNQITATANYGYHFVQWSDGVTDNPRTITLTQDTVLTAEFALTTAGQCGKNLYWVYDTNKSTLTITGSGDMYNERPWGLFANALTEVALPEGLTHIGDDAFVDCINLKAITIPASVTSIGANSFAGCRRIRDVYCYPLMPPYAEATSFENYNANLNVPCDFLEDYQYDPVFGSFKYFNCMGAESDNIDSNGVIVTPGTTDVTIVWPTEEDADTYSIVIYKDGRVFCTLTFNANGQLLNIAFAPGRDGNRPAQYAEQVANGYRFTVTGLTESTKYEYNITTKDESDNTISTHSGEFTTKSNTPTDLDNTDIQYPISDTRKLLRDNQLYIYHNGSTYTIMGAEIQ